MQRYAKFGHGTSASHALRVEYGDRVLMSASEVADAMGLDRRTVVNMALRGELPYVRAGLAYRFCLDDVAEYLGRG